MQTTTEELLVLIGGRQIGIATRLQGSQTVSFAYDEGYAGIPLSLSLPVSNRTYKGSIVDNYLAGLLPDDARIRRSIGMRYGIPQNDNFGLLQHIGFDCPGAVQFCTPDSREQLRQRESCYLPLGKKDIEANLKRIASPGDPSWQTKSEHWSLGGQQAKLAIARLENKWYRCEGSAATTHILKPGIKELRDQSLNECICLTLAARCGIDAAEASFEKFGSKTAVSVKRFDRIIEKGRVIRLHQEDLCQALSVSPLLKYSSMGGPTAKDILTLLDKHPNSENNRIVFTAQLFYNYLIGAPDAHAKNYSLLLTEEGPFVSPLYDCASAYPYNLESGKWHTAMRIGDVNTFGELSIEDMKKYSEAAQLPVETCTNIFLNLAQSILDHCDEVFEQFDNEGVEELKARMLPRMKEYAQKALALDALPLMK